MKIKQAFIWNWRNTVLSMAILYGILLVVYILLSITFYLAGWADNGSIQMRNSSSIWLFVMGIVLYQQGIRMSLSMSVSRKSFFASFALYLLSLSAATTLADLALMFAFSGVTNTFPPRGMEILVSFFPNDFSSLYYSDVQLLFGSRTCTILAVTAGDLLTGGLLIASVGAFIGAAYYRMNRITKVAVSIGVPVLILLLISLLAAGVMPAFAYTAVTGFLSWYFAGTANAWLCAGVIAALLLLFTWLMTRRAPIRGAAVVSM